MPRLALIYGGASPEHSVSLVSALGVFGAIDKEKYEVIPVGITKSGRYVLEPISADWKLADQPEVNEDSPELLFPLGGGELRMAATGMSLGKIDIAFPVLHGINGEDGSIQGLLQLAKIPYVGNGVLASALAMDKAKAKAVFRDAGIAVADDLVVTRADFESDFQAIVEKARALAESAVFVKPASSGSSVGVSKVADLSELKAALEVALSHDDIALVERQMVGRELECSVLELPTGELKVSLAGEIIVVGREFYDYEAKYLDNSAELRVPTSLTDEELAQMHQQALAAFRALGCSGLARVDFFLTAKGFVLTEVNTMPGFTPISMYPSLWQATSVSFEDLVETLIQTGLAASRV